MEEGLAKKLKAADERAKKSKLLQLPSEGSSSWSPEVHPETESSCEEEEGSQGMDANNSAASESDDCGPPSEAS